MSLRRSWFRFGLIGLVYRRGNCPETPRPATNPPLPPGNRFVFVIKIRLTFRYRRRFFLTARRPNLIETTPLIFICVSYHPFPCITSIPYHRRLCVMEESRSKRNRRVVFTWKNYDLWSVMKIIRVSSAETFAPRQNYCQLLDRSSMRRNAKCFHERTRQYRRKCIGKQALVHFFGY